MGLPFDLPAGTKDPIEAARKQRFEALMARIKVEAAVVEERKDMLLDQDPVLNRILHDPSSATESELNGFLRDGDEIVEKIRALVPVSVAFDREIVAFDREIEALVHEDRRLARVYDEGSLTDVVEKVLKCLREFIANLRSLADWARDRDY